MPDGTDIAVVGTGLAGLSAALALAARGVPLTLIGPRPDAGVRSRDTRSTALFGPSLALLERTGVMRRLRDAPTPLSGLRLIDRSGGWVTAPEVLFKSSEIGIDAFGWNFENATLLAALADAADDSGGISWLDANVDRISRDDGVTVATSDGVIRSFRLVVGADGANSTCRSASGVSTQQWSYPQTAIATRFAHARPHDTISTELHRRAGPLTTVPLPGRRSSLVWVDRPEVAAGLMALDDAGFAAALERELGGALGPISDVGPRAAFPLSGLTAEPIAARRIALVGEAAHRLPPIGAQGLNLGLRDAAWLADFVADAVGDGGDPGANDVLDAYCRARRGDVASRTLAVDLLNRSLIADLLPFDMARAGGLTALSAVGPLRQLFMRQGMAPAGPLPSLMQVSTEDRACGAPAA